MYLILHKHSKLSLYIWHHLWWFPTVFSYPVAKCHRLLHCRNLVAVGLSVGYETWPRLAMYVFLIQLLMRGLLNCTELRESCNVLWTRLVCGNSCCFSKATDSLLAQPVRRQMPALRAVQGDCERVYKCQEKFKAVESTGIHSRQLALYSFCK